MVLPSGVNSIAVTLVPVRPNHTEQLRGQRSTSKTTNRPLEPPAAHVRPSGEKQAQRTPDPSPKSNDRTSFPVSELTSASPRRTLPANSGAVGWNASGLFATAHRSVPAGTFHN